MPANRRDASIEAMNKPVQTETAKCATIAEKILVWALCVLCGFVFDQRSLGQAFAPIIVVETSKGTFAFETYPEEAQKTVAHVVELVKQGFYDGQRIHRAVPGFVVQWGDPRSKDLAQESDWGLGPAASSGKPIGASEVSRKRTHTAGAVGMAHPGLPSQADSQIYVTLANRPDLNFKYTVFGHVIEGEDVPSRLERGDVIRRVFLRE
jgi:cyclophilin family peptidyl-prolyl cis-trans isomerase